MAALIKKTITNPVLRNNGIFRLQFVRLAAYWNKDWKPGPYPKTDAERIAAARKYGLLPQDYEPYPDDGMGYGDYPKLTLVSSDQKDPNHNWDYPDMKRNYGEPMHVHFDMYVEERMSTGKTRYTMKQMVTSTFGVFGTFIAIYLLFHFKGWVMQHPWVPKQFPGKGTTHFTFEPVD